jgi:putative DNA primase/helicase
MVLGLDNFFKNFRPLYQLTGVSDIDPSDGVETLLPLRPIAFNDFVTLNIPPREMLLSPILPERSLAMLYAPRGVGKTLLGLSIGLAVAKGSSFLRWSAPRPRRVLYVDGEMPLISLQERLKAISQGLAGEVLNDAFQILAADSLEQAINLGSSNGQQSLDPLLDGIDLLIIDNLSTLCTTGSENGSDSWVAMQTWLLKLRRKGIAVLLIHHAGTNGRQRGTSRREDALDTVIALRQPESYMPNEGARFEVHFEKLRNRVDAEGSNPFEARIESVKTAGEEVIRWSDSDLQPPLIKQAATLFAEGLTVRGVAASLQISKTEAGRLRIRATEVGLISSPSESAGADRP